MTCDDFSDYHWQFVTYATYLVSQGRLSKCERSQMYIAGFPQPVWSSILQRLLVKKPDVLPDNSYDFADIQEAAVFILNSGSQSYLSHVTAHVVHLLAQSVTSSNTARMDRIEKALKALTMNAQSNCSSSSLQQAQYQQPVQYCQPVQYHQPAQYTGGEGPWKLPKTS